VRDDELVVAALAGDPAAFAALVEGNRARVEAVSRRLVGDARCPIRPTSR